MNWVLATLCNEELSREAPPTPEHAHGTGGSRHQAAAAGPQTGAPQPLLHGWPCLGSPPSICRCNAGRWLPAGVCAGAWTAAWGAGGGESAAGAPAYLRASAALCRLPPLSLPAYSSHLPLQPSSPPPTPPNNPLCSYSRASPAAMAAPAARLARAAAGQGLPRRLGVVAGLWRSAVGRCVLICTQLPQLLTRRPRAPFIPLHCMMQCLDSDVPAAQ